jgi:chromosome segregation ATPase
MRERKDLEDNIGLLANENQRLDREREALQAQLDALRAAQRRDAEAMAARLQDAEGRAATMGSEAQRLRQLIGDRDKEIAAAKDDLRRNDSRGMQEKAALEGELTATKQKMMGYEGDLMEMAREIARLQQIIEDLERRNAADRSEVIRLEKTINDQRHKFEMEKKIAIEQAVNELIERWGMDRPQMEAQIDALKRQIADLEGKLAVVVTENDRMNLVYGERQKEVDLLKSSLGNIDKTRLSHIEDAKKQTENSLKYKYEQTLREKEAKFNSEKGKLEAYINGLVNQIEDTEGKLILLGVEIDRLQRK